MDEERFKDVSQGTRRYAEINPIARVDLEYLVEEHRKRYIGSKLLLIEEVDESEDLADTDVSTDEVTTTPENVDGEPAVGVQYDETTPDTGEGGQENELLVKDEADRPWDEEGGEDHPGPGKNAPKESLAGQGGRSNKGRKGSKRKTGGSGRGNK